ncbi:MAG: ATP-dependent zinc metalloprotease FtsH [Flavobacteriales bacterium]
MQKKKIPTKKSPQNNSPLGRGFKIYWIYGIIALIFLGLQFTSMQPTESISETKFLNKVENNEVKSVTFVTNSGYAEVELLNSSNNSKLLSFRYSDIKDVKEQIRLRNTDNHEIIIDSKEENNLFGEILGWILPLVFFIGIWYFIMRKMSGGSGGGGGQIFNIGKSKATLINKEDISVTFDDVAGLEGAKEEITEIVDFLKYPEKYTKLGGKIPRGAMLIGPPGTGKTLLAKAVAGEAQVPFFSLSGSDFVEMFVGVGASRVRDLFKQAKEKAPSIIFIDEIDAIGRARGKNGMTGGNDERENTLNQLLTEMDGFGTNTGVIVMAATNRADVLDKALIRPGRFDRQIYVDLPDLVERKEIFEVHLKPLTLNKNIDRNFLARQTPGFSGADIANVCNESALIAARKSKKSIGKQDFLDAMDRIIGGMEKKSKIISPIEKKTIAFHEAGHATVSWMLQYASPLVKVTIVPRGKSLGAAWYLPEERQLTTTEQLKDEMCAALGGRAAEEIFFGKISTGALSDLEKVTKQAYAMICIYGMSDKIGNISYYDSSGQNNGFTKPYSEERAKIIDEEVTKLIENQYQRAKTVLSDNKEKAEELATSLLINEVIFKTDLESIFGERQWKSYEEEKLNEIDLETKKKKKKETKKQKKNNNTETDNGEKLD